MFILSIDCPPKSVKPILFHFVDKETEAQKGYKTCPNHLPSKW